MAGATTKWDDELLQRIADALDKYQHKTECCFKSSSLSCLFICKAKDAAKRENMAEAERAELEDTLLEQMRHVQEKDLTEKARLAQLAKEREEEAENARLAKARAEKAAKEREDAEKARLAKEREEIEKARLAKEREEIEKARLAKEGEENARLAKERDETESQIGQGNGGA